MYMSTFNSNQHGKPSYTLRLELMDQRKTLKTYDSTMFFSKNSNARKTIDYSINPTKTEHLNSSVQSPLLIQISPEKMHLHADKSKQYPELLSRARRNGQYENKYSGSNNNYNYSSTPAISNSASLSQSSSTIKSINKINTFIDPSSYLPVNPQAINNAAIAHSLSENDHRLQSCDTNSINKNDSLKIKPNKYNNECGLMPNGIGQICDERNRNAGSCQNKSSFPIPRCNGFNNYNSQTIDSTNQQKFKRFGDTQSYTNHQTTIVNGTHNKAIRSSSYPTNGFSESRQDKAVNYKRQSLQLFYTPRSSFNNSLSSSMRKNYASDNSICRSNGVALKYDSQILSKERVFEYSQILKESASNEPKHHDVKRILLKSSSCGDMDTEYVTLAQRYKLHKQFEPYKTMPVASSHRPQINVPETLNDFHNKCKDLTISDIMNETSINNTSKLDRYSSSSKQMISSSRINITTNAALHNRSQLSRRRSIPIKLEVVQEISQPVCMKTSNSTFSCNTNNFKEDMNTKNKSRSNIKPSSNGHHLEVPLQLKRCKSLSDLQNEGISNGGLNYRNYSDDEDGDHFGFLSHPVSFFSSSSSSSAAMNKGNAKSPSPSTRMLPKRWRSKSKAVPSVSSSVPMWTPGPQGSCLWSSVSGRKVQLRPVSILNLTEPERMVLQKIALSKLQSMELGCPVSIPNENVVQQRNKKSSLSLKRRSKSIATSSLDVIVKEGTASGLVFGIPLIKCLMNDRELEKGRRKCATANTELSPAMKMKTDSTENLQFSRCARKSSSSSQGSLDTGGDMIPQKVESLSSHKRAASTDSLSESESSRNTSSSLIDALSLSTSNPASRLSSLAMDSNHHASHCQAQVPYVVKACFKHIETYGLQTLGIFRVGCSKKRVKQLREEFDSGKSVLLTEEHNPHDVGALLKEYFRDLPDPLLTREMYLPFLHAERIKDEHKRQMALSLLISMLPVPNRDTLWALLQFLATVSQHAPDHTDEKGEILSGNKMDAHNLATLFGPNILHRIKTDKSSDKEMLSESAERVEQSKEIIEVVKDMIDNHHELYEISGSLRDEVLRVLIESNQEITEKILRHIANQNQIEADPESMCSVFEDSQNSPMLYHSINSDADLLAFAQKQATEAHRQLRNTKSSNDSLDSPLPKSRVPILSESQAFSPTSRDNHRATHFNSFSSSRQFHNNHHYPSPVINRVPVLKFHHESTNSEQVFPGKSNIRNLDCLNSEGFNQSLNIPQPAYFRKNSSSSTNSDISCFNGLGASENGIDGQWTLPTPPSSREISPKPFFQSTSSSSTLVGSSAPSLFNYPHLHENDYENNSHIGSAEWESNRNNPPIGSAEWESNRNNPPIGSAEWERDRWKLWEKIAAHKKNMDTEQETLV